MIRRIDLRSLDAPERRRLARRSAVPAPEVRTAAAAIVAEVRRGGDEILAAAGARYGGGRPGGSRIPTTEIEAAAASIDPALAEAIATAAANVRRAHEPQHPDDDATEVLPGVVIERRWAPLRRVGCYVPGGAAPLPSALVMTVVPAQVAGVPSIVVATPATQDGSVDPAILATAALLGVGEIHAMGGAQAIAALAYGTETIEPVQKIVGPGNAWVTAAKLAVAGDCSIDMLAGPSEALVLADASADPRFVAADLLAQAEHGSDSLVLLVTADPTTADRALAEVERQIASLERQAVIEMALTNHGLIVIAADETDAVRFADEYAPEHLSIHLARPELAVDAVTSVGSVFVGAWAPEAVGDYASGANHVLPTGGLACSQGPLAVEDFGSWRQVQRIDRAGLAALRPIVGELARAEGLTAHRNAVEVRFEEAPA